jgi:hypothetical protein
MISRVSAMDANSPPPCGEGSGVGSPRTELAGLATIKKEKEAAARFDDHHEFIACGPPPPTPPRKGEGRSNVTASPSPHCVLAGCGGAAEVWNSVASSTAVPIGVGTIMRNGTRMRVPAIGTKAISMLRWAVRYLITGRSGI